MKRMKSYIDLAPGRILLPPLNCIPALLPLLLTDGNTAVWRRRDGAYRGTAPFVLARLAVCSYDASTRWLERCDASALRVRRIS
jgi:hypothetical protein